MLDANEQRVIDDIDAYGWHVICIPADQVGPGFAYSIGLMKTFDHPEVIIFGLNSQVMHGILNNMVAEMRRGGSFREDHSYSGLLENYACAFRPVCSEQLPEYFGYAIWYSRYIRAVSGLEAMQCFWPDKAGRFPWKSECVEAVRQLQPLLYLKRGV
jgi:hypothetical protein